MESIAIVVAIVLLVCKYLITRMRIGRKQSVSMLASRAEG